MKSVFSVFQHGLQKTAVSIFRSMGGIFADIPKWNEETYENIEAALLSADFGPSVTSRLVEDIRDRYKRGLIKSSSDIVDVARSDIASVLRKNPGIIRFAEKGPTIIMIVGVNGSGKTTTAGKLAYIWKNESKKIMLAACDTFRAAAVEQLKLWGERTDCHVVASHSGADPSSVAFDAVQSATARNYNFLIIDTAGRQHTKKGLMEELSKMRRVITKLNPEAPHNIWLTIDAGVGTNALSQAREFIKSAGVTGMILTKLDGTGKGGMAVAIQEEFRLPVFFVGLGEKPEDFQAFDPEMFSKALFEAANR